VLNPISGVPAWWRPPLEVTRLLDALASDAAPPFGMVASGPELLVPALGRFPSACCITLRPWSAPDLALLPSVAAFVGVQPTVVRLSVVAPQSLKTVLWLSSDLPPSVAQIRRVATCLAPSGVLIVVLRSPGIRPAVMPTLRLHRELRRAGLEVRQVTGYLGPRALAWSIRARLALAAGRPDRYDRYHAAMRAAYAESWPLALLCRTVVVMAQTSPGPLGPGGVPLC